MNTKYIKHLYISYKQNFSYYLKDFLNNETLKRNKLLDKKYKGKRIFILGSGGSIKNYNLKYLKDEYVMTQNNFHVHKDISEINPSFHCVVPFYQTNKEVKNWISWIKDMEKKLPNAQFFWGINTKHIIDEKFQNLSSRSYYVSPKYDVLTLNNAKIDITKSIMRIPTATTQCITVALYMGFSEIYLLGFDNDQVCHEREKQNRFYGMSKITNTEAERNQLNKQREQNITRSWYNKWLTSKQLDLFEEYSKENNIKIINLSEEGLLDNFKRMSSKEVLGLNIKYKSD